MAHAKAGVAVVLVTCPSLPQAERLARLIVQERLAACVNVVPGVRSYFRWQGRIDRASEVLLIIKTTFTGFPRLARAIKAQHSYDVPEIIALPVLAGHPPYLAWVHDSLKQQ